MDIKITEEQYNRLKRQINEEPSDVALYDEFNEWTHLSLDDIDALCFGFYQGEAYVGYNKNINVNVSKKFGEYLEPYGHSPYGLIYHSSIYMFNHYLFDTHQVPVKLEEYMERRDYDYPGRLWLEHKIISFYNIPPAGVFLTLLDKLEKTINTAYDLNINIREFKIDTGIDRENDVNTFMTFDEYMGNNNNETNTYDINQIHLLNPKDKRNSPQMKAVRNYDEKYKSKRFEKTPEYLWNFYKTKGLAETILNEDIDNNLKYLKNNNYHVIDKFKVHNYTMFLFHNDIQDFYEIGLTSNNDDFIQYKDQIKKPSSNHLNVIQSAFNELMNKVREWITQYNYIIVGSYNLERAYKYKMLFDQYNIQTTSMINEPSGDFDESWYFYVRQ